MKEKKTKRKLTNEEKIFIKQITNYAIMLCITDNKRDMSDLCNLIRIQNERRCPK